MYVDKYENLQPSFLSWMKVFAVFLYLGALNANISWEEIYSTQ